MRQRLSMANRARWVVLLALALIVRALVPTGWMPVATADGVRFELCAGQSSTPMAGMHHGHRESGKAALPDHPCAFAGIGLAADAVATPAATAFALPPITPAAPPASVVAVGRGLAAPPPPATGPPAFA